MFIPLHTKTSHSPGYGTARADELVRRAAALGLPALALTDVENLYGQVEFHHAARAWGVRPITGVELRAGYGARTLGRRDGRLVLLARDASGYESLCRIISRRRCGPRGGLTPDPLDCLEDQRSGLFYLSDDNRVIARLLASGIAEEDVRFLLVRPGDSPAPRSVRAVADTDVVMLDAADHDLHVLQVAIRTHRTVLEVAGAEPAERRLLPPAAMRALFADVPETLAESLAVAEACTLDLSRRRVRLPSQGERSETSDFDTLVRLVGACLAAGRASGSWPGADYDARVARELEIVRTLGFAGYFLIVAAITDEARRRGIPTAIRGSASGSLLVHVLGIGDIDPIRHGLLFERFIRADRRELPDIDLDIASSRREELLEWTFDRFGPARVAMVSAHQTFRRRGAFRAGLAALGCEPTAIARFASALPSDDLEADIDLPLPIETLPARLHEAVPLIGRLIGKLQHISVHPGGIVIADPAIASHAPLERAPKGVIVTQYDMHALDELGLVKIDLLGNRALDAIAVAEALGGSMPAEATDARTLAALATGDTIGCFQVETPPVRGTLRKLPLRSFDDLVAALAIVRPGPAAGEAKAAYIRRAHGEESSAPPHPRLAAVLARTHGLMLFEEDLIASIATMTGWSLERADDLRGEIIRLQDAPAAMATLGEAFVEAVAATGATREGALAVRRTLERFAAYSFNRAHATSYAGIAWRSAWLKLHHPEAFACGVLDHYGGHYPLRTVAADFARHGVRLLAPHVNHSDATCRIDAGAVRIGLASLHGLSARARQAVLEQRPFRNLPDLLERVRPQRTELRALVLAGACDGLAPLDPAAFPFAHEDALRLLAAEGIAGLANLVPRRAAGPRAETFRALVRVRNELQFIGMHVSGHPMRILRPEAARDGCVTTAELARLEGRFVRVAGLVAASRRLAARGGVMQFVTLEDEHGLVETALFPGHYAALGDPVTNPGPWIAGGRVVVDHGDVSLVLSQVAPFHRRARAYESAGES